MKRKLIGALLLGVLTTGIAAADDARTLIDLPPEVRTQFLIQSLDSLL